MEIALGKQMKELDRQSIEETKIPGIVLMENAGRETVAVINDIFEDIDEMRFVIVVGKGNNGGDGFVIARHLWNQGADVLVLLLDKLENLSGDAEINARICRNMKIPIQEIMSDSVEAWLEVELENADVVIDAIFGTGLTKPVEGIFVSAIQAINSCDAFVISVDIPSGIFSDSPVVTGQAVWADVTVTFGLLKPALVLYPAAEQAGQIFVVDISIPEENVDGAQLSGHIITSNEAEPLFIKREANTHKGSYGHLLVIAGSPGKTGAAALAGQAALRAGTGLVTVAVPCDLNPILEVKLTEVMTEPVPALEGLYFDLTSEKRLREIMTGKTAILLGPGIGTKSQTGELITHLVKSLDLPLILDADALNLLGSNSVLRRKSDLPLILTPHPGEMSRLLRIPTEKILSEQLDLIPEFAEKNNAYIVFKTARTLIAFPDKSWWVNITGNPGMASGGTGDVLAGLIGGLLAQKIPPDVATKTAVFWHGLAGDLAAKARGEQEMAAGDIIDFLSAARVLINDYPEFVSGCMIPYPDIDTLPD